jgi:hypothetical protein
MLLFVGRKEKIAGSKWSSCYMAEGMSGGISLGLICIVSKYLAGHEPSVRHELYGHTRDSRIFGPLYLLVIGLPSLLNAAFGFTDCYYDFYTEKRANKAAGLKVNQYCGLEIDEDVAE